MRYNLRLLKLLAVPLYLVAVLSLPMPWLTHPRGSPVSSQPPRRRHSASQKWKRQDSPRSGYFDRYRSTFNEASPNSSDASYSRALIISRQANEEISWASIHLPHIVRHIYTTNEAGSSLHTPRNKGHEVIVYLTHLVEHYDDLADINIFMHKDRFTHHNEGLLDFDSVKMINRLRDAYVIQNGYTNLQCSWGKSCPAWLNSTDTWPNIEKQEQVYLARVWQELFPGERIPTMLAAPCCAQYAVSKERIRAIPQAEFVFFRDWLLKTPLTDYVSGRLWEYLWHYLFTGEQVRCPLEHDCLCRAYGLCFGGEEGYRDFKQLKTSKEILQRELDQRSRDEENVQRSDQRNHTSSAVERIGLVTNQIQALEHEQKERVASAMARGDAGLKQG